MSSKKIIQSLIYIFLGLVSAGFRFWINFSQELIPGVNGGYYPMQVRSILENGHLGFSDMPLLFYLNAAIIKFMSLIGFQISDTLILNVVKIVDSISLPLLLFPLYRILRFINPSKILQISILSFSVLSLSPLILVADLQKNALAIFFVFCFLSYNFSFLESRKRIEVILYGIFLILTGLTHFGTFIFGLFFFLVIVLCTYKRKAIFPMMAIVAVGLGILFLTDTSRFNRLINFWNLIFEKPALLSGTLSPPDFVLISFSIVLTIMGLITMKSKGVLLTNAQKSISIGSIVCLLAFSFPLLDTEYFRRLSLFLFIPQVLLIIQLSSVSSQGQLKSITSVLLLLTFLSILAVAGQPKEPVIDKAAYEDLKKMQPLIEKPDETIVIARHGLEWWTAWALKTKVGQDKAMEGELYVKYRNIIILNQIIGFSIDQKRTTMHEPIVPENSQMIHSSKYFKAFKINFNQ